MAHKYDVVPFPDTLSAIFHCYVFSRDEKQLVYVGLYLDKQAAMNSVRSSVSRLGLRCLFYWDEYGNYRCSNGVDHVYGRIALNRSDVIDSAIPLPFDTLDIIK